MGNTIKDLMEETGATEADVRALVDQLLGLDPEEDVIASEVDGVVTLTTEAAEVIALQLKGQ